MSEANFTFDSLGYTRPNASKIAKKSKEWLRRVRKAKDFSEIAAVIKEQDTFLKQLDTAVSIAHIRHTVNTADEFYDAEMAYIRRKLPVLSVGFFKIAKALVQSPFRKQIDETFGAEYCKGTELQLKAFTPKNVSLLQKESKLTSEYEKLMSAAQIPFRGETVNLYGIQKYFTDPDRETRKEAFAAYSAFYANLEPKLESIFDGLVKNRTKQAKNLGFATYTPLGYLNQGRTDYGKEEVASFREQVREYLVPVCEALYKAQAKRIGVDKIMAYDEKFIFPDGNAVPAGDREYLVEEARKMYRDISPETGAFIDFMIDHELMDLDNKPNKASTGYCTDLPMYGAPFVFSCFNHTTSDVDVLTHELGHAFAGYEAMRAQELSAYAGVSTDIAEIHSMAMEQFAYPYAEQFFGEGADKYRFQHLQEAITFVPFGVAVDEFQHIVYENPSLTPKERTACWRELEKKYMPWRAYADDPFMERGGYWYHKLHIFQYPFYYINYTLTTMGAMEFKKRYAEDRERALRDYIALCRAGGSKSYLELLRLAELSVPFEAGSVERAMSYAVGIVNEAIAKENA